MPPPRWRLKRALLSCAAARWLTPGRRLMWALGFSVVVERGFMVSCQQRTYVRAAR